MARKAADVSDAQLRLLRLLWEREWCTARELCEALYGKPPTSGQSATVQKLLHRLEVKRFIVRDRNLWPHQYLAVVSCDDLIRARVEELVDRLCRGSIVSLLPGLVRAGLQSNQVDSMRAVIDSAL